MCAFAHYIALKIEPKIKYKKKEKRIGRRSSKFIITDGVNIERFR